MAAYSELDGNGCAFFMNDLLENSHAAKRMDASERQKVSKVLHQLLQDNYLMLGEHAKDACLPCNNVKLARSKNTEPRPCGVMDSGSGFTETESVDGKKSVAHEGRQNNREYTPDQGETLACIEEALTTVQQASDAIMDAAEAVLEKQEAILALLEGSDNLIALFSMQKDLMTTIITACSFDDLTGQRLTAIKQYVLSVPTGGTPAISGVSAVLADASGKAERAGKGGKVAAKVARASGKTPGSGSSRKKGRVQLGKVRDLEIKNSVLKGPTLDASQSDVDDLLATLET